MKRFNMLFIILILSLAFQAEETAYAQWNLQSPIPTGRHLYSVYFLTPFHGFIVGDDNHLIETTDGGVTWITRMSAGFEADPFRRIVFSDNMNGYITGNNNDAWRTTNGGATWIQMTDVPAGSWSHIDFVSPTTGFIGANGALAMTTNNGQSWVLKSGYPDCPNIFGMDFRDELFGLAGGLGFGSNPNGIFKTTDGGTTWQNKSSVVANDILWLSNNIAIAAAGTSIYSSTNEGETWTQIASNITTGLSELAQVDVNIIAGVSAKGDIWRSTNGGQNWTQVFDGPGDLPAKWSISFNDNVNGWLVGQSGFIFTSNNGGVTWTQINNGAGVQITDIEMLNDLYGLAVGQNGYLFRTTDGGQWWEVQKLEVTGQIFMRDESLNGISIVDDEFAVVAGPGGTVFRTYDSGVTWESVGYPALPGNFFIEDVEFINRNNGWLVGLDLDLGHEKTVYRTTNGGTTWMQAISQPSYMWAVDFVNTQYGWITTTGELFFRTTDGGASWISGTYPPYFTSPIVSDIKFADQNTGWAVGWDGFVARSTDGGVNWIYQDIGTTEDHIFSIHVVNSMEAWISGRESNLPQRRGVVYHTTNGGADWSKEITSPDPYWGYAITGSQNGIWIGGFEGQILRKDKIIPVELISFTASVSQNIITLNWVTVSETNNRGFEIQRVLSTKYGVFRWERVGFVNGNGTTTETSAYSFTDEVSPGKYSYRLKQIDFDGTFEYSNEIEVDVLEPSQFSLEQNYPNPFNPSTKVTFSLPEASQVKLSVFNVLGEEVKTLLNENREPGVHTIGFDASGLASGVYLYRIQALPVGRQAGNFVQVRKMILTK
jgi:photosystem II stability/assembly factor-like uncharacterized protein